MSRRNWKRVQPRSLREALELCKDFALDVHNLSVDSLAEAMDEDSKWTVYGWLRDGSIPGRKILAYQRACRADFITRWLAHADGKLLVDIPRGRRIDAEDVNALQGVLNGAVGALLAFAAGKSDEAATQAALTQAMEGLAWHRENVARHAQPELDFTHGGEA